MPSPIEDRLTKDHDDLDVRLRVLASAVEERAPASRAELTDFAAALGRHMEWEERVLFPILKERRRTDSLEIDHERIRESLATLAAAIDAEDWPGARSTVDWLAALLKGHNDDEERSGYPEADAILGPERAAAVAATFDEPTLTSLLDTHARIAEALDRHRDLVVALDFRGAAEALREFGRALQEHMEGEERWILPVYETRVPPIEGGGPGLFREEHRGLLKNLERAIEAIDALAARPGAGAREAQRFLHEERMLVDLLAHHDRRERNVLYPKLDAALSPAERAEVLARMGR